MFTYHDNLSTAYRAPFGALKAGQSILLRLNVPNELGYVDPHVVLTKDVPGNEPVDVFAPEYVDYAKGRVELLFFSSWLSAYAQHHKGASAADLPGAMKLRTDTVLKSGADGMLLHEAHTFEYYKGFGTIREMRRRFDRANRKK